MRLLGLLCVLLSVGTATATTYFVAPSGNDADDGLTLATSWATLQRAADAVNPGDTVHVQAGGYAGFYLDRSGTSANPITFVGTGATTLVTSDNGTTPDGINLEGASHVVLDGFTVNGRTRAGIRVVLANGVTVRNCSLGNNARWGLLAGFTDDLTIEDTVAYGSVIEHGIYVGNSSDRAVIRRNHVYDNHANGIHMNGDASLGGDGTMSDCLVEANVIHGNGAGGGSGINMDGVVNSVIRNNLLYDGHAGGISLYRIDGGSGSSGNLVVNNTVLSASDGRWCVNINTGSTGNTLRNNILFNAHPFRGVISIDAGSRAGFVSDYNSVMSRFSLDGGGSAVSLATWQAEGYDTHSFLATPADHFLAPGSDYRLVASSPAVDAGTPTGAPANDLDGGPRPVGAGWDVGAYELQLVECGDGGVDAGEECGEPGLSCADACTGCVQCACVAPPPVCGDGLVCGTEACELDTDCSGGAVCVGCQCENAPVCGSGLFLENARLKLKASPASVAFKGELVVPVPFVGVNPPVHGVRIVVDAVSGTGGFDATIPGGVWNGTIGWRTNTAGTKWTFVDTTGVYRFRRVVVRDLSGKHPGRVKVVANGKGGTLALPNVAATRTTVVAGSTAECAARTWNPPAGARPRCDGDGARMTCR